MFYKDDSDHDHHGTGQGWSRQARRGDMRLIVLNVLKERPMHGYEIIRHLEAKSHGMWRPSAGSIYPTLQLLEEEDLIKGRDDDGKRIYELTDTGQAEAKSGPMEHWQKFEGVGGMRELHKSGFEVMHQLKQIVRTRSEDQISAAAKVLAETRTQLSDIINKSESDTNG